MSNTQDSGEDYEAGVLQLNTAFVCPRCTVVYATDEGCSVCDYDDDLDEFEVGG